MHFKPVFKLIALLNKSLYLQIAEGCKQYNTIQVKQNIHYTLRSSLVYRNRHCNTAKILRAQLRSSTLSLAKCAY
jgi:hypothetical protein